MAIELDDRNELIAQGQERASGLTGAALLWPETLDGPGIPCRATPLTNASRLNSDSYGGASLFDDVQVTILVSDIPTETASGQALGLPREMESCRFRPAPGATARKMRITMVESPAGGAVLILHLNNFSESA